MKIFQQALISFAVLAMLIICTCHPVASNVPAGYDLVAENQLLTLYFNYATAEIAVYDQRTDLFWYSNPVNRDSVETIARGAAKDALAAQLKITYYEPGDVQRTMDSYNDSVVYEQFEVQQIDNGIEVEYVFGKEWDDDYYLPLIVEQSIWEDVLINLLDAGQERTISGFYSLVELVEPPEDVEPNIGDRYIINSLDGNLTARDERTIHNVFLDHVVSFKSNLTAARDVTDEDLQPFIGQPFYILKQRERDMLPWDKSGIIEITREVGFDPYLIGESYQLYNMESGDPNIVVFTVPIQYRLEDDNLVVNILSERIEYPQRVMDSEGQNVTYPLVRIDLLPYFGAAEIGSTGYMFVPDGSGSLIYFDNEKTHLTAYSRRIYDQDFAVNIPTTEVTTFPSYLPVFGIKNDNHALFAIVEDGASIARIHADVSGRRISYNTNFTSFQVIEQTTSSLQADMPDDTYGASSQWVAGGGETVNVYQEAMYDLDIQVRYAFLADDAANYVGMAHYYQDYLIEKDHLSRIPPKDAIPLMLELVGAVPDRLPILGVPRDVIIPLTTYKQAQEIIGELLDSGINNLNITYVGWMKHGIQGGYPNRVRFEPELGTEVELNELVKFTRDMQVNFYPAVDFMYMWRDRWFDGFTAFMDASRALTRNIAFEAAYLISPRRLDRFVDRYLTSQQKYNFTGIYVDLGDALHGDYRRGSVVIREEAIDIVVNQLSKISKEYDLNIQAYGTNAYALPYVSSLVSVPLDHSGIDITDEAVPFMPIVLHGFIDFAGRPLNYVGSPEEYLLKMIEVGAKPYFRSFYADPNILKGSLYDMLYTGQFTKLLDDALSVYDLLNGIFKDTQEQRIVGHEKLLDKVYATTFENGKKIIVNYNDEPIIIEDIDIEPQSFLVIEGE